MVELNQRTGDGRKGKCESWYKKGRNEREERMRGKIEWTAEVASERSGNKEGGGRGGDDAVTELTVGYGSFCHITCKT